MSSAAPVIEEAIEQPTPADADQLIGQFAEWASGLGHDAAAISGTISDLAELGKSQEQSFARLTTDVEAMLRANDEIGEQSRETVATVGVVRDALGHALEDARVLARSVANVQQGVATVTQSLGSVSKAATDISDIALQTRIIAFNASIEAARAGQAGRGFGVVAEAIKDLAQKVQASSQHISQTVRDLAERIERLSAESRIDGRSDGDAAVERAAQIFAERFPEVEQRVEAISTAAAGNRQTCDAVIGSMQDMTREIETSRESLDGAVADADRLLSHSESLIELTAASGHKTVDSPFIDRMLEISAAVTQCFEAAIDKGEITEAALFDEQYQEIEGSNPQQYLTRYIDFTDRVLPEFQEPMLEFSPLVAFCACVDRNGFLPTHNHKFSRKPGNDVEWNKGNCRNRRLFNDRTGLAAGRNLRPFLLQTYRRDMGGGEYVVMKDLSVPITIRGKHWGGVRLGYRFR